MPLRPPLKGPTCLYFTLPNKIESVAAKDILSFCAEAENTVSIAVRESSSFMENYFLKLEITTKR